MAEYSPVIRSLIEEAKVLTSEDVRRQAITMRVSLSASIVEDNATYKVPATHKMGIEEVFGHLGGLVSTDSATPPGGGSSAVSAGSANIRDILIHKAQNCRIALTDTDTSEKLIGENQGLSLASLLPIAAGQPLNWRDLPALLSPAHSLQMTATLISTVAAQTGTASEYGLTLSVVLVRVKKS